MPFNGAGVYTAPGADFPAVTQTVISSTHYNNVINDIATALSLTLTRDGQATVTGNIPFGGFRATNVGITGIAGSVGTPAINVSDAGTGLYRSAASELAVTVAGTQRGRFDSTGLIVTGTVNASTSVVTPLVDSGSTGALTLQTNNGLGTTFKINNAGSFAPGTDNVWSVGLPANRVSAVFTPIIDSGTAGSLSLKTNNGETIATFGRNGTTVNQWDFLGSAIGSGLIVRPGGTDTNVNIDLRSKGTGSINLVTDGSITAPTQFQILHTASASRNITITGSNGGNPTIGVTAGNLAITPAVVIAGASLTIGTTPSTTGAIRLPYAVTGGALTTRNSTNTTDLALIYASTINSIPNVVSIGDLNVAGTIVAGRSGGAAPTTSDIGIGFFTVWRDTGGATTKLYYNNGGVIQSVALA